MAGTVTFLFTDVEGSTRLWEEEPERMKPALAWHDAMSRAAVEAHGGLLVKSTGDGVHAAFDNAVDALQAAVDLQQAMRPQATNCVPLRVRCGLHAGAVERRDNDYFGSPVNRAARIMSAAHGGQVLLSQAVADCVRDLLPHAVSLRDLGKVRLKDLSTPEHVYQVVHPQLRQDFPALRSLEATPNNLPQQATSSLDASKHWRNYSGCWRRPACDAHRLGRLRQNATLASRSPLILLSASPMAPGWWSLHRSGPGSRAANGGKRARSERGVRGDRPARPSQIT